MQNLKISYKPTTVYLSERTWNKCFICK